MKFNDSELLLLRHAVGQRVVNLERDSRRKSPVLDRNSPDFGKVPGIGKLEAYRELAAKLEAEKARRYAAGGPTLLAVP